MAKQISLGWEMYLFTVDDLGKSGTDLVISSHGGYSRGKTGSFLVPPWTTIKFYGPHKMCLVADVNEAMDGNLKFLEAAPGGSKIRDYQLSKFQSYHGAGENETYDTILAKLTSVRDGSLPQRCDVLTIRNRWWLKNDDFSKDGVALSKALRVLESQNRKYSTIHSLHCRNRFEAKSPKTFSAMSV